MSVSGEVVDENWMKLAAFRRRNMRDDGFLYLHPGVEALGYVKSTTPALLSSTRALRLDFTPSLVSTSPPKPSSEMMSPTWGLPVTGKPLVAGASAGAAGASAGAALGGRPRGLTASLTFAATLATLDCFFAAGGSGGGAGALRLRSSTGISAMGGRGILVVWYATWTALVAKGRRDNGCGRTEKATT